MPDLLVDDIIGHAQIIALMRRWVERPGFAYLFSGPAHIGKQLIAERFVRALADLDLEKPLVLHPDILVFEPEEGKKEVAVKSVREYRQRLFSRPQIAKRMVAYLPKMDQLNEEGFNALLKVIEEPPAEAVFVAVAEQLAKIPQTILSRVIHIPLSIVPQLQIQQALEQRGFSSADAAGRAKKSRGRPGLALADQHDLDQYRADIEAFINAPSLGYRLAAIDRLRTKCESTEEPAASWKDALSTGQQSLRNQFGTLGKTGIILGQGIADAFAHTASAIGPRVMLEAAAVNAARAREPVIKLYPQHLPASLL